MTTPTRVVVPPLQSASPSQAAAEKNRRALELLGILCSEYLYDGHSSTTAELGTDPELPLLASLADRHGVLPLLARALRNTGTDSPAADAIQQRAREIAVQNLRLSAELLRVIADLGAAGIHAIAYKGPALAQQLYGDVSLRQFFDLDILVAPADVPAALDVLHRRGYADILEINPRLLGAFIRTQCEWQLEGASTVIELHWAAFPKYFSVPFPVERLQRAAVPVSVAGRPLAVPAPDDLLLLLCVHGTKHFWYRLGWLLDIALLLRDHVANAEGLLRLAESRGVRRILLLSAALAARAVHLELPLTIDDAMRRDHALPDLADIMLQALHSGEPPADKLTENIVLLRCRERWPDRIRVTLRLAATPGPLEWLKVPLPRLLSWMYPLVRMVRAVRYLPRLARRALAARQQ